MQKIIYIHNNYEPEHFPVSPDPDDRFYTYGFGSNSARNFKKYTGEDYEVEMWRLDAFTDKYYEKTVQDVKFRIFPAKRILKFLDFSFRYLAELKKEIKKSSPILFVSHTHYWLLYQIAFFFKTSPIVTSHHGDFSPFFRYQNRKGLRKIKDAIDIIAEKIVMKNVDQFLVCDFNEIPYIKKAAPKSKVQISSTGLNISSFPVIEKKKARELLGWEENKKYIIYVGKLYHFKQPAEMISIWKEVKKEIPDAELVILGNTTEDEYYNLALESGAMVIGRVLNKDLNIYYSAADVYLLVALRKDYFGGIGIAPLESLACNTPVVSYSMRNYIGKNLNEICEMPDSTEGYSKALIKVLKNPGAYVNMRKSVEEYYSYHKIAQKTKLVFDRLIKEQTLN